MTERILKTEAHLHLYGCLTSEDLYEIGSRRYRELEDRLNWFADEYEKVYQVRPDYKAWWHGTTLSQGYESFKKCFEFTEAGSFSAFQAKFNLLIALNPPDANNLELARKVFTRDQGYNSYREYRTFLPQYLSHQDREAYLLALLHLVRDFEGRGFKPRLALSILRTEDVSTSMYEWLVNFTATHPWTTELLTGIDFCGSEKGFYPSQKKDFIQRLYRDNESRPKPWDMLYHVGEMWDDISLLSATRWVAEAAQLGARRLGHAMALGVDPEILRGQMTQESLEEFHRHKAWLKNYGGELSDCGYSEVDVRNLEACTERHLDNGVITWVWDDELCSHAHRFQNAVIKLVKKIDPLIEVCVTSNMRIGQLRKPEYHPLRRFLDAGLRVAAATDDPGIFAITLGSEEATLREVFKCTDAELRSFETESLGLFL